MQTCRIASLCAASLLICGIHSAALAKQEWGDLSVTFLHDGEAPKPKRIEFLDGPPAGVKEPVFDQSILVDEKTRGIANVVVWIRQMPGGDEVLPFRPSYDRRAQEPVKVTCQNCQFEPRVLFVRTGQTMQIENADPIGHNPKADLFENGAMGELMPPNVTFSKTFRREEFRPRPMSCNIYSWMDGWIMIRNDPYVGISDSAGKLAIKNLPVGKRTFVLWHELSGYIVRGKRGGKDEEWKTGMLTVDIKPGDNDLGEIVFKPERR